MLRAPNVWDRYYRHHEAPWRGEREVAALVPLLGTGPVLELGCGNGKLLRPLVAAGVDVVGLDVSWNALERLMDATRAAARRPSTTGPPVAQLVLADAVALPFADASFAAVLDVHCTGHLLVEDRGRAVEEIARVVRPGGVAIVERLGRDDLRTRTGEWVETDAAGEPDGVREAWTRRLSDGRTTHFSDEHDVAAEYASTGLRVLSSEWARRMPRHRGTPVLRSSVQVVLERPRAAQR